MRRWPAALLLALTLSSCGKPPPPPAPVEEELLPSVMQPVEPALDVKPYLSDQPVIEPQSQPVAGSAAQVTWTESPTANLVPDQPVTGRLHGEEFICRYASVRPEREGRLPTYQLRLSNKPKGELCGFNLDDNAVTIEWHTPVGAGEWQRLMSDPRPEGADAWYVVEQADGTPYTRTVEWAAWVKVESVAGSTEPGGISSLTGRLVIMFADKEQSWVAGTFVADGCAP